MIKSLQKNWRVYLIEAWALGMFMVSACTFVILMEHPSFGFVNMVTPFVRRFIVGAAMGITAILLIYSKWGKTSGAHMNPAVTLANYQLDRIAGWDAFWYIAAQGVGSVLFVLLFKTFFFKYIAAPQINYLITIPGHSGIAAAFWAELIMAIVMFSTILVISNSKWAKYTAYAAGLLVCLFITFEAPISGMSINPARTFGSAFSANNFTAFWLYIIAPILGMQLAAFLYRKWYFVTKGECKSMKCFMSGQKYQNKIYNVIKWFEKSPSGIVLKTLENNLN